jgi:predicted amidophosphoribosyltransferase
VAQVSWVGFIVLTGIPGLLAFLSVQEWPARESCPQCHKPRLVDREHCEHCGAEFPPPEKTGTEIFEPAGTAQA